MRKSDAGKGSDPRNLGPKFHKNFPDIDWRKLRPSADWQKVLCPDTVILDPDGWNRLDFENSWNELITKEEFNNRLMRSTISFNPEIIKSLTNAGK